MKISVSGRVNSAGSGPLFTSSSALITAASERSGNDLKGLTIFDLKAKARIRP